MFAEHSESSFELQRLKIAVDGMTFATVDLDKDGIVCLVSSENSLQKITLILKLQPMSNAQKQVKIDI